MGESVLPESLSSEEIKKMKNKNNAKILICILSILILESCIPHGNDLPKVSPGHIARPSSQFQEIWSRSDIYNVADSLSPTYSIGASSGLVCFVGALDYRQEDSSVNCMNGKTGEVVWLKSANSSSDLLVVPDGIYVPRSGGVTKYDLAGNTLWINYTWGSGILYIYIVDSQLQVSVFPSKLVGLDISDGKEIVQYLKGEEAFISTPADTFINDSNSILKAVILETGQTKWETKVPGGLRAPPVFLEDVIILRSGDVMGSIYAIDRAKGNILWKTAGDVISNIGYSPSLHHIYYLTKQGKILSADVITGSESVLVEFTSTPFITISEDNVGSYDVAFDDTTNMLYALLGDSRQLFAFEEKKP